MHSTGFSLPLSWTARVVVLTVVVGCSLLCYHMCCICVLNCVSLYFYHHTYVHYAIHVVLHVAYTRYTYLCCSHLSFFRVFYMTNLGLILTHVISLHMVFTYLYMFVISRVIHPIYMSYDYMLI